MLVLPTVRVFDVMPIGPFVFDSGILQHVPKVDSTLPILIGDHAQERIAWAVYLRRESLDFVVMFKSDKPHVNKINNILRKSIR